MRIQVGILVSIGILFALAPKITINSSLITGNNNVINLDNEYLKISKISEKIHIINNSGWVDFKNAGNCTGSGTYSDPYVIEDLVIDGGGFGNCILIENTNVYFKIENCTVYNSGGIWSHAGIRLSNVTHSQLINNNCSSNSNGILLYECFNNNISGNTARNNINYGIYLTFSNYNTISGNTASNNYYAGIRLFTSDNSNITGNTVNNNNFDGIHLARSHNNTVSGNTANDNDCGIFFSNSTYNTISGNTANNNNYGIYLLYSDDNTISGNIMTGNDDCIVEEENCKDNVFENNNCGEGYGPISGYNVYFLLIVALLVSIFLYYKRKRIGK